MEVGYLYQNAMRRKINYPLTNAQYFLKQKGYSRKPFQGFVLLPNTSGHRIFVPKDSAFSLAIPTFAHVFPWLWNLQIVKGNGPNFLILHLGHRSLNWTTKNLASLYFCSNVRSHPQDEEFRDKGWGVGGGVSKDWTQWLIQNALLLEDRIWQSQAAPSLATHSASNVPDLKWNVM